MLDLAVKGVAKAAKKLGFDYAEAVVCPLYQSILVQFLFKAWFYRWVSSSGKGGRSL